MRETLIDLSEVKDIRIAAQKEYVKAMQNDMGFSAHRNWWHYLNKETGEVYSIKVNGYSKLVAVETVEFGPLKNFPSPLDWIRQVCQEVGCCGPRSSVLS